MPEHGMDLNEWRVRARGALRHRWVKVAGGIIVAIILLLIVVPFRCWAYRRNERQAQAWHDEQARA